MPTKVYFVGTPPGETTGADGAAPTGHSPATLDQTVANLRAATDRALAALGGFTASQTPGANQIPVQDANGRLPSVKVATGAAFATGSVYGNATNGLSMAGTTGSTNDMVMLTPAGQIILRVPTGTKNVVVEDGNLHMGLTGYNYHLFVKNNPANLIAGFVNSSAATPYGVDISFTGLGGGAGGYFFNCSDTGGTRFQVLGNGNAQNANNSYGAISDLKLKENIAPARGYLTDLCRVNVVKYSLKADASPEATHLGVIAQELEQIFPGMVEETADMGERESGSYEQEEIAPAVMDGELMISPPVYADDLTKPIMERYDLGTTTKSVKYSVFVPMLITAVQELKAKSDALEARLSALEGA